VAGAPGSHAELASTIEEIGGGKTRVSIESEFPTVEAMEELAARGMEDGLHAGRRTDRRDDPGGVADLVAPRHEQRAERSAESARAAGYEDLRDGSSSLPP
jgi:hypothetical protein